MSDLNALTAKLVARQNLLAGEVQSAVAALSAVAESDANKATFLIALADKGESAGELAGFAASFRALAINPGVEAWAGRAIAWASWGQPRC